MKALEQKFNRERPHLSELGAMEHDEHTGPGAGPKPSLGSQPALPISALAYPPALAPTALSLLPCFRSHNFWGVSLGPKGRMLLEVGGPWASPERNCLGQRRAGHPKDIPSKFWGFLTQ